MIERGVCRSRHLAHLSVVHFRSSLLGILLLLSATSLAAQGASQPWLSPTEGNWVEGCGDLVIRRAVDGKLWSVLRPGPGCDLKFYAEPLVTEREYLQYGGPTSFLRQRFNLIGSRRPYHLPAWFVTGSARVYVEGHLVSMRTEEDLFEYPSWSTCDSAPCHASVGPDDLQWGGGYPNVYGRIPASGNSSLMAPPRDIPLARDARFELVFSLAWRPDSVIIPLSIRAVVAGTARAAPVPAENRPGVRTPGLRGSIRTDLVAVLPSPAQRPGRADLLRDLCGGRQVTPPAWATLPQGVFLLQDDKTDGTRDLLRCLRQDRAAEAWNVWRPDSGQRLLDTARIRSAPIEGGVAWLRAPGFVMLDRDVPPSIVSAVAGALGADSVLRSDTSEIFWYLLRVRTFDAEAWEEVSPQLERIAGRGSVTPTGEWPGRDVASRAFSDSEWHVSAEVAALVRRSIRAPIRGIQEDRIPSDTAVAGFTVFYGDSTRCFDLSCGYPRVSGLRVGKRLGWLRNAGWMTDSGEVGGDRRAFEGQWPTDTLLLARLEHLARRDELPWESRAAIADLRVGLLNDPRATAEWRHRLVVAHRSGETGDAVDSALCLRAAREKDLVTLMDLATRGAYRPLACAEEALTAARTGVFRQERPPSEVLLYYAARTFGSYRADTIAQIAWRLRDWAVLGVTGPPGGFDWSDSLTRALHLPPEAGVEGCIGARFRQVESDGCNALTAYALRSGDRRLLIYLANRGPSSGPGGEANWILVNRHLRGDPLRARWPRSWTDD